MKARKQQMEGAMGRRRGKEEWGRQAKEPQCFHAGLNQQPPPQTAGQQRPQAGSLRAAGSSDGGWAEKRRVSGSSPSTEGVLVVGGGASTSSELCRGTLEQGPELTNAHIDDLATHPGVGLPSPSVYPPRDPGRDKAVKKMRDEGPQIGSSTQQHDC